MEKYIQKLQVAMQHSNTSMMKVQCCDDQNISDIRLTMASSCLAEPRSQFKRKISQKIAEPKRRGTNKLKQIVQKQRVQIIKKEYVNKLKMLIPPRKIPSSLMILRKQPTNFISTFLFKLEQLEGIKISSLYLLIWKFIILLKVISMLLITSLKLVFDQIAESQSFFKVMYIIFFIGLIDVFLNFIVQRFENNRNYKNILVISKCYLRKDFLIDFLTLVLNLILLTFKVNSIIVAILLIITFIKLWGSLSKIQILQHIYIANVFHEKYYTIMRVLFFNCLVAHFVAITALLMAQINSNASWLVKKNIQNVDWLQKYTWAYYWAVNIMFTVGFGDIVPSTQTEALIIIFIEMVSCIILAYNINIIGSILSDIKQKERERKNQLRILLKMSNQNQIPKQTVEEAANYIDQSFKIKAKFPYDEQDQILQTLPTNIKRQYIKQTHKKMLMYLPFSYLFSHKSLLKIAQKISRKLSHPQQIIWKKQEPMRLVILNKGKLGLTFRRGNSKLNGQVIQTLQAGENQSKLLSLKFFKNQSFAYDVKSMDYNVIYHLSTEQFIETLSQKSRDYEIYFNLRDKAQFRIQADQLYECKLCTGSKHDLFCCPKMHYITLKRYIIMKQVFFKKFSPNPRFPYRRQKKSCRYLKSFRQIKSGQENYRLQIENEFASSKILNHQGSNSHLLGQCSNKTQKTTVSIRSNSPFFHVYKQLEIEKLNTILAAKFVDQQMYIGFWNIQCDTAHNYNIYLRQGNCENFKDFSLSKNKIFRSNSISNPLVNAMNSF